MNAGDMQGAWNTLAAKQQHVALNLRHVFPASVELSELVGSFAPGTTRWRDGYVTGFLRQAAADSSEALHALVLDGPVSSTAGAVLSTVSNPWACKHGFDGAALGAAPLSQ